MADTCRWWQNTEDSGPPKHPHGGRARGPDLSPSVVMPATETGAAWGAAADVAEATRAFVTPGENPEPFSYKPQPACDTLVADRDRLDKHRGGPDRNRSE